MNDKQIECFLEAGKNLNFTKAAQNLYLPQPAVSRYISALEQELGVSLFIRENSRNIALSDEGRMFFNFFQRYRSELTNIRKALSDSNTFLRIGYNIGWNVSSFLPKIIKSIRDENPDFRISFECLAFNDLIQALEDKHLDAIIITDDYVEGKDEIVRHKIADIQRIVVYSELLPNYENIRSGKDFEPYTFYMIDDPKAGLQCRNLEMVFNPYNYIPKFTGVPNLNTLFAYVENGFGVAVLDSWYQGIHHPGIHYIEINDTLPISLAWNRTNIYQPIDLFYNKIKEHFS